MGNLISCEDEFKVDKILSKSDNPSVFYILMTDPKFFSELCKKKGCGLLFLSKGLVEELPGRYFPEDLLASLSVNHWALYLIRFHNGKLSSREIPYNFLNIISKRSAEIRNEVFELMKTDKNLVVRDITGTKLCSSIESKKKKKKIYNQQSKEKRKEYRRNLYKKDKERFVKEGYSTDANDIFRFVKDKKIPGITEVYKENSYVHRFFTKSGRNKKRDEVIRMLIDCGAWNSDSLVLKGVQKNIKESLREVADKMVWQLKSDGMMKCPDNIKSYFGKIGNFVVRYGKTTIIKGLFEIESRASGLRSGETFFR